MKSLTRHLKLPDLPILALAGFGCLVAAAFVAFGVAAGLGALGTALLIVDYGIGGGDKR